MASETLVASTVTKKKYVEMSVNDGDGFAVDFAQIGAVLNEMRSAAETGDKWTLTIIELTEDEFEALPEWEVF